MNLAGSWLTKYLEKRGGCVCVWGGGGGRCRRSSESVLPDCACLQ